MQKKSDLCKLFGLAWVDGTWASVLASLIPTTTVIGNTAATVPHDINSLPANPDFFQIINYALTLGNGGVSPAPSTVFTVGASLIDQYDGDDLNDPDPNYSGNAANGNTITIIDYGGASYAYGIEAMSYDDPNLNLARPPFAPNPLSLGVPLNYVLLNRRFENVGEFGYAYNPASTLTSKTLDFASATSKDRAILDFFTYNEASPDAGIVNLNTRNIPVLASDHKRGAFKRSRPPEYANGVIVPNERRPQRSASHCSRNDQYWRGAWSRVDSKPDVTRLAAVAAARLPTVLGVNDETKQTIARALAEMGQTRTWNLLIDVIAQTGQYKPNSPDLTGSNFIVQGENGIGFTSLLVATAGRAGHAA